MSVKEISINELFIQMSKFQGYQIEIDLYPVQSSNTYYWFSFKEIDDAIEFLDRDNNYPQMLRIFKDDIIEILYSEGKNIFDSVFTLNMKNEQQIQICVYEEPVRCYKCQKIVNLDKNEFVWKVDGSGGYLSHFDGDGRICINICDDCFYEFVYGCEFVDFECCLDDDLEKEKTCH